MRKDIFKTIIISAMISTLFISGITIKNHFNNNLSNISYAAKVTNRPYSAKGKTTANLIVRKGAGTTYTKLATLKKGTNITIVSKYSSSWYKIKYKTGYGYVSSKYVSINNSSSTVNETTYSAVGKVIENLTVRKSPATTYAKLGSLKKNTKITIVAKASNNWYKIKFHSGYGYVSGKYISIKPATPSISQVTFNSSGKTTANINVRKGPDTSCDKIQFLKSKTNVVIVAKTSNNWYKIKLAKGYGYVSSDYIRITKLTDSEVNFKALGYMDTAVEQ